MYTFLHITIITASVQTYSKKQNKKKRKNNFEIKKEDKRLT